MRINTSLANLVTHQVPTLASLHIFVLFLVRTYERMYLRTDTMCETNDHLFGRGLVGQK